MPDQETKYDLNREKESQAYADGAVSIRVYTSTPQVNISVMGSLSDACVSDLQNAVDEILKFHGQ